MKNRKLIIGILGVLIVVAAIFIAGRLANTPQEAPKEEERGDKVVVHTRKIENSEQIATVPITGRVVAADKLDLYAEVSGVSTYGARPFKAGNRFRKGEVLLKIDAEEFSRSMASAKSQFMSLIATVLADLKIDFPEDYPAWRDYLKNMDVNKSLQKLPEVQDEQLKFFLTGRNIYSTYYNLLESETRLAKYVIRAPFDGTITESYINQASLVRTGQQLGEFIREGNYELEASVTFDRLAGMKIGDEISFNEVNGAFSYVGKLVRINEKVDAETQLIKVYFSLKDPALKSGVYLEGNLTTGTFPSATVLPVSALVDGAYVFVVQDGKAVKTPVEVLSRGSNQFIAGGLPDGAEIIVDKKNGAFEGTSVEAI
ncbi:efflux RND transporter periplasmic adaptor subunit [Fulvivirga sedimenti]|uniref:Efflux RND transporter periplasmic adaptor subunit n=1 Tax=Fulvivirga sedimenti TaxID=2879465 RepID=A0A9X1KZ51_9BACT|nr:efflux RND transporter periplasmic adaptor subunit [Fulvivirga sedimenti]MCA6074311.1 efflux RND transporter periplasmic adaptor subunit [Fulvivirga sedimenti]